MNLENKFDHTNVEFWENRYKENNINWDIGAPTPIFKNWAIKQKEKFSICVLGAGNGWDAIYLSNKGHDVTAVDFSQTAIKNIKKSAKASNLKINVLQENIFNLDKYKNIYDVIIEYTCFCAIDPKQRYDYVEIVNKILKKGGKLVAIFFPINKNIKDQGPPFAVNINKTIKSFNKYFTLIHKEYSPLSIKPRKDNEIFVILEKNEN